MLDKRSENERVFDTARRWVEAWNSHDRQQVEALYAPDFEGTDVADGAPQHGPRAAGEGLLRYQCGFPDFRVQCEEMVVQGDRLVIAWTARGTHKGVLMHIPPTGRAVEVRGASFLTLKDGLIRRSHTIWDMAGLLRGIGLLPDL